MGIDEVEAGRRAPMPEQPRLDVLGPQRLAQKRIVEQVDLPDRQIIGGPPIAVNEGKFAGVECLRAGCLDRLFHKSAPVSTEWSSN
ncbi:hypothetical protein D3C71_2085650 [compost metagenome]